MAADDPKKGLAILIGQMARKPKSEPDSSSKPTESESEPDDLEMVAQDLIDAVESGDSAAVAEALRAAHSICQDYD